MPDDALNTLDFSEDELFKDVDNIDPNIVSSAAQKIAQELQQNPPQANIRMAPTNAPAPIQQVSQPIPGPPIQAIKSEEDKAMDQYNIDKQKLFGHNKQLTELAYADKNGFIVRNFGMAQLVININNDFVRINGLIVMRALKVRLNSKKMEKAADSVKQESASFTEDIAGYMYEVWGEMENGRLGLTSSYVPSTVVSIIDLNSGYDIPPED